jgi:hypothetical protein
MQLIKNIKISRRSSFSSLEVLTHLTFIFFLAFMLGARDLVYFRDYSITFEGSYRIYLGQIPYKDFFSPVGPVSFLLPALFFKLLSPNWSTFILSQFFLNVLSLLLVSNILVKIGVRPGVRYIALLFHTVFYLLLQTHPWYNTTGAFLLLACTRTAMSPRWTGISWTGILSGIAILTKQDFGILSVAVSGIIIVLVGLGSDLKSFFPNIDWQNKREFFLPILLRLGVFSISIFSIIFLFAVCTDSDHFLYWFNYGQLPHDRRHFGISDFIGNSFGTLGVITAAISLARNNFRLFISSVFITAASISRTTSGLGFTHYYFAAFIPLIIDELIRLKIKWKILILIVVAYTSFRVMIRPMTDVYHVFQNIVQNRPEHFFFDHQKLSGPLHNMPDTLLAFSHKVMAPEKTIDALLSLKQSPFNLSALATGKHPKVLNISELTPIYSELNAPPPTGLPLWFHTKVSLFPNEILKINKILNSGEFDLILLQGTHEGTTETYKAFLSILDGNDNYFLYERLTDTPANFTWPCKPDCQGDIYIYLRKS